MNKKRTPKLLQVKDLERYRRTVLDTLVDGFAVFDAKGVILTLNKTFADLFDYSEQEIIGKSIDMLLTKPGRGHPASFAEKYLKTTKSGIVGKGLKEITGKKKDGTEVVLEIIINSFEENGETVFVSSLRDITERKKVEVTFTELQEKLKLITDNTTDIIALREASGNLLYVSPSFERHLKYNIKKQMGKISLEDILHPDDREPYLTNWRKTVFGKGVPFSAQIRLRAADGNYLWFEGQSQPVKNEHGKVVSAVTVAREITDRKKAEAAFEELQNKLKLITDNTTDIINLRDATGKLLYVTPSAERQLKYKMKDFIGTRGWQDIIHPDERDAYVSLWKKRVLKSGKPLTAEFRMRDGEGKYHWFESNNRPVKNDAGEVEYVVTVARNIDERKKAEAENLRLGNILEDSLNEIYVLSPETLKFSYVNKQGRTNLGYSMEELRHMTPADVGASRSLEEIREIYTSLANKQAEKLSLEGKHRRKDGSVYDIELRLWLSEVGESPVFVAIIDDITEKKAAEAAFQELQEKLRLITDNATDIINLKDANGKLLYVTPSAERQLKHKMEDFIGNLDWQEMIHPDDRDAYVSLWKKRILELGRPLTVEYRLKDRDGNYHWFESSNRPVKNDAGEVEYVVTVARNIDERKEVEEALRKNEMFIKTTLKTMVDGLVVINEKGVVLSINQACADIFGYTEKEIIGNRINMLMHEYDKKHHDGYIAEHLKTGKAKIVGIGPREVIGKRKDGSDVPLELAVNSHKEEKGGTIFVGSLRDITQRKEAEAAFQELQEKLRLITENATDIISLRDSTGKMVYLNPSFERQLKHDPNKYMEQTAWKNVMHPDDRNVFMKNWKETVFKKGLSYTSEHRLRTAEGEYLWFESQSRPVKNEAGEVIAAVTISRNITEQRKMEEQLRQAKKMEAVGQLTGGVAHEFNNILTTILASLGIFETLEMEEDTRECLKYTIDAAKRGAILTDHLIKFSRKEELEPETLNPNDLFEEINSVLEITVGKNIRYHFQPAPESMYIHVDRNEIEDALVGLCNNAKEATEQAGGTVKMEVSRAKIIKENTKNNHIPPGDYCRISVSDNGMGMSEDVLEKALDPFFTTKAVGEGAGLGLSSVYGFVRQSDGYLKIDSKPDQGTSVYMYFPLVKSKPKTKPEKASKPEKEKASAATILFVSSDDKKTSLATKALAPLAGTILTARNFTEAKKIIKNQADISLLITQMTIGGEDAGQDLVQEFKSKFKKGKILFATKHPDKAKALIKKSSLIGEVLTRPYPLSTLITKTDNLLKTLTL